MSNRGENVELSADLEKDVLPFDAQKRGIQLGFPNAEWRRSVKLSTMRPRRVKRSAGSLLVFCGKLAALEILRRGCQAKCRLVWWALQGLSVSGASSSGWFRRWAPFRVLADASESFSKPMLFLSLTSVLASAYKEARERKTTRLTEKDPALHLSVMDTRSGEIKEEELLLNDKETTSVALLKEELSKHGVVLPDRVDDAEVMRFWFASNGDTAKYISMMRKTLEWRKSYKFMSPSELRVCLPLVFWHLHDSHGRPILIIRLGLACTTLTPAQRPQFAQAVISQVDYGVHNLVTTDDPRLTVVMDCRGTSAFGFPVQMMKSCIVLVQEHYPTRLAALFVINAPPLVRAVANAIIQVLKPATREKVRIEGDKYMTILAKSLGGATNVPAVLGGSCSCDMCVEVEEKQSPKISFVESLASSEVREIVHDDLGSQEVVISIQQPHLQTLRVIILGLVCLWIVIAMMSGRS